MTVMDPMIPSPDEPLLPATTVTTAVYTRPAVPMPLVRVNLLPSEVVATRRGHRIRRIVVVALLVLVLLLAAVSFLVRSSIGSTRDELAAAQAVNTNLQAQQGRFAAVVAAQGALAASQTTLGDLTSTDVGWAVVTGAVRAAAPTGVTVTGVDGTGASNSGAAGSVGGAPGSTGTTPTGATATGATSLGTLTVTGLAPDPAAVAAYVDALARLHGLTAVAATGVFHDDDSGSYGFGIVADLTAAAHATRHAIAGGH